MATVVAEVEPRDETAEAREETRARVNLRPPIWALVVLSRLIVVVGGALGPMFGYREVGWMQYDTERFSSSLGVVGNILGDSTVRWDSIGYLTIAQHGYTSASATRLFPLYPLLIRVLTMFVGSPVIAGEMISLVAFAVGLMLVHRIAKERLGQCAANATVLLIAFSPLSFVLSAVYTESLLLALLAASFYLADHGRFGWACVAAAAAAITHVQGILMVAPLAIVYWNSHGRTWDLRRLWSPGLLALALPPLALGSLFVYMHAHGWGWLAPITNQNMANAGRTMAGPLGTLILAVADVAKGIPQMLSGTEQLGSGGFAPDVQNTIYLVVFVIAILSLVNVWRRLPRHYFVFALLAILVCTSSSVASEPLKGFDRYLIPIFPLWIGAGAWLQQRKLLPPALAISTVLLIFYTAEFSRWLTVF